MPSLPELIGILYDSLQNESGWQKFLDGLTQALHAKRSTLFVLDERSPNFSIFRNTGWAEDDLRRYQERYVQGDLWRTGTAQLAEGTVARDWELAPREAMQASAAYREFYAPLDCVHGMGGVILAREQIQAGFAAVRGAADGAFGEAEKNVLRELMPHLTRVALLHAELESLRAQLATLTGHLDDDGSALLLVDEDFRVLYANRAGRELTAARDGLAVENGRLRLLSHSHEGVVRQAASAVGRGAKEALKVVEVPRTSGRGAWQLFVSPTGFAGARTFGFSKPAYTIFVRDAESGQVPDLQSLGKLFGFSAAEARVAGSLARGRAVSEIADQCGIPVDKVRTHIKKLLVKTGTEQEGELVSLLLNSAPGRQRQPQS